MIDEKIPICGLSDVRQIIMDSLLGTSLWPIVDAFREALVAGKMLRARLVLRVGAATGVPHRILINSAAAVEMVHAASLLHDDIIDGDRMRRGSSAFWVKKGVRGAVLLGDLLFCTGIIILTETGNGSLVSALAEFTGEMCGAEAEQELLLRGKVPDWETCVRIARRKTGALFAFAGCACANSDNKLRTALQESGYAIGTAYQLADDIFDAYGDQASAGKTLGNDAARGKVTAASAWQNDNTNPRQYINRLCESSADVLSPWPSVCEAWNVYLAQEMLPAISNLVESFSMESVAS